MREVGFWPVSTPFVEDGALAEDWEVDETDNLAALSDRLSPLLLAFVACLVLCGAWWLFAGAGSAVGSEAPVVSGFLVADSPIVEASDSVDLVTGETAVLESKIELSGLFTPEVLYWRENILEWSRLYSIDPNIVATIMQIESCGHPEAVSIAGARGLFQVMPFHFRESEDMLDPNTNAMRGLLFFREQMRYTGGDVLLSFAGYNGGYAASGGSYQSWPNETQRYYYWAQGIYEDAQAGRDSSSRLDEWLTAGGASGCHIASQSLGL